MKIRKDLLRLNKHGNEKGSITLEFLGVLPYFFLFFLMLWQAVSSGYAVMTAQSAVNEAAKICAVGKPESDAESAASNIVGSSNLLRMTGLDCTQPDSGGNFEAVIRVSHGLIFIPAQWRDRASIAFTHRTSSRVIK